MKEKLSGPLVPLVCHHIIPSMGQQTRLPAALHTHIFSNNKCQQINLFWRWPASTQLSFSVPTADGWVWQVLLHSMAEVKGWEGTFWRPTQRQRRWWCQCAHMVVGWRRRSSDFDARLLPDCNLLRCTEKSWLLNFTVDSLWFTFYSDGNSVEIKFNINKNFSQCQTCNNWVRNECHHHPHPSQCHKVSSVGVMCQSWRLCSPNNNVARCTHATWRVSRSCPDNVW